MLSLARDDHSRAAAFYYVVKQADPSSNAAGLEFVKQLRSVAENDWLKKMHDTQTENEELKRMNKDLEVANTQVLNKAVDAMDKHNTAEAKCKEKDRRGRQAEEG